VENLIFIRNLFGKKYVEKLGNIIGKEDVWQIYGRCITGFPQLIHNL
jgi:hypothetical protein